MDAAALSQHGLEGRGAAVVEVRCARGEPDEARRIDHGQRAGKLVRRLVRVHRAAVAVVATRGIEHHFAALDGDGIARRLADRGHRLEVRDECIDVLGAQAIAAEAVDGRAHARLQILRGAVPLERLRADEPRREHRRLQLLAVDLP